jgi:ribosomal protein S18 acetylase RimI-like enzyme
MNAPGNSSIRRAGPEDADVVRAMIGELADYQNEGEHVSITVDRWRDLLRRDDVIVLLAEHSGSAIGYVSALRRPHLWSGEDVLALDDLYVREQYRDAGVGRALTLELARYALPERLTITWGMRPDNHDAQRFYTRLGARLRPKIVAQWDAKTYSKFLRRLRVGAVSTPRAQSEYLTGRRVLHSGPLTDRGSDRVRAGLYSLCGCLPVGARRRSAAHRTRPWTAPTSARRQRGCCRATGYDANLTCAQLQACVQACTSCARSATSASGTLRGTSTAASVPRPAAVARRRARRWWPRSADPRATPRAGGLARIKAGGNRSGAPSVHADTPRGYAVSDRGMETTR